jgi:hypothetical protein
LTLIGRADELIVRALVHGEALPGDRRFVDFALALFDDRIDGDLGAGTDQQQVAHLNLGGVNFDRLTIPHHHRLGRSQVEQGPNGVVRAPAGTHLEPVTEQDEGRQHRRGLVEHVPRDEESRRHRVGPADADGHGDKHHHVERPSAQRPERAGEEDRRGVKHDRQAQQQQPDVTVEAERRRQLRAEQLGADHRPRDDRDCEHQRDQEAVAHVPHHGLHRHPGMTAVTLPVGLVGALDGRGVMRPLEPLGERVADVSRHRLAGTVISALLNPRSQRPDRCLRRVEAHRRGLRDRISVNCQDAQPVAEHALHHSLLRGVLEAADVQDRRLTTGCGSRAHEFTQVPAPGRQRMTAATGSAAVAAPVRTAADAAHHHPDHRAHHQHEGQRKQGVRDVRAGERESDDCDHDGGTAHIIFMECLMRSPYARGATVASASCRRLSAENYGLPRLSRHEAA